jgi:hypothetical protein
MEAVGIQDGRKVDVDSCWRCFCRMDNMKWDNIYILGDDDLGVSTLKLALIRGGLVNAEAQPDPTSFRVPRSDRAGADEGEEAGRR